MVGLVTVPCDPDKNYQAKCRIAWRSVGAGFGVFLGGNWRVGGGFCFGQKSFSVGFLRVSFGISFGESLTRRAGVWLCMILRVSRMTAASYTMGRRPGLKIPKGFRPPAQRLRVASNLGTSSKKPSQPRRGCVKLFEPCHNPFPPSIFTWSFRPRTAGRFFATKLCVKNFIHSWVEFPRRWNARRCSLVVWKITFICFAGLRARSRRRNG